MKHKKYDPRAVVFTGSGVCILRPGASHYYKPIESSRKRLLSALYRMRWLGMPGPDNGFVHFKQAWVVDDINAYLKSLNVNQNVQNGVVTL